MQQTGRLSIACFLLVVFPVLNQGLLWQPPVAPPVVAALSEGPTSSNGTFQQLIDHSNPDLGTFSQRYWWDTTFWDGPGSPVVIFTPGEVSADFYSGYLTNRTITGLYAQAIGAAVIVLEHRYWGQSSPFQVLDTQNLRYLTLENAVADMVHFARTVNLPFDPSGVTNAPRAPWISVGGSYSGALAAWIEKLSPGTFWAHHASSAPVQAIRDFWQYFQPIQDGMPRNCSLSMTQIATHIDSVLWQKKKTEILRLKQMFGLEKLEHDDDFASCGRCVPSGRVAEHTNYSRFYAMCDSIQGARPVQTEEGNNTSTTPKPIIPGTAAGFWQALANYASWFKNEYLPGTCNSYGYFEWRSRRSVACFDTYNETSPMYKDYSPSNTVNRQWFWMLCNQPFFYWQTGAPLYVPSIVSRYLTPVYMERQCRLFFSPQENVTFGAAAGKTEQMVNGLTGGWFVNTTRLIWVNGEFDPWRSASVSSAFRPGGPMRSSREAPVYLIRGAHHCTDLNTRNGEVNEDVRRAQLSVIAQMVEWIGEFYDLKKKGKIDEDGWI
ncbi:hypothetical protein N656DRAFT_707943 [Canariomyces notabilis]|uniref:Serine peptidase n=1 Tax=Canariomyces notabilis TaxID=2074819 RepID=A0AAN6TFT6_9PEZI|nr:hypothetical protein N656DRAFT_707943 [Canariomyces arenarius]